jgi:hypothetical protein
MPDSAYHIDPEATRALQESPQARASNLARMQEWGAWNLVKVESLGAVAPSDPKDVTGYISVLAAISGRTPKDMVEVLGLNEDTDLILGAVVYRLDRVPTGDEFVVRGYTTLPDGLRLRPGVRKDAGGYDPGHGAWQVRLVRPVPARLIAVVHPGTVFQPPLHPRTAALYPPGHPAALR